MSQIIAGVYEIQNKIGAGGGGVVYLGRHLRLDKPVVLKADKRTLAAGIETLRREVDMLKGLSQTYIPQVYDFVQEDGVVYTVMDYIEGESLDKLLARGQRPAQPEVIRWADQLLQALVYLHGQPPYGILHGDIKPANIMLRPGGDVCLIDFNIALALGEDGAVKVGFSRGYASPEHYGADYIRQNRPAAVGQASSIRTDSRIRKSEETQTVADADKTVTLPAASRGTGSSVSASGSTASKKKGLMLDVRSDIYSLGATLYHMISGIRPEQDARRVKPLGADICSPQVWFILGKAMAPDPEDRYQSAEEMRLAFLQLHRKDKRVIQRKRQIAAAAASLAALFLFGGSCSFVGLKQLEQIQTALALSEYSAGALSQGDVTGAVRQAMQGIPDGKSPLEAPATPQIQKALTDALGVYELSDDFRALDAVSLPAAPFGIAVSPAGSRFAAVYAYEAAVFETDTQREIARLPIQNSALADLIFLDETRIVYAGEAGVSAYDLDTQSVLWEGDVATNLSLSGDGEIVAAVDRDAAHALLYRISDGEKIGECSFGDLHLPVAVNDSFADPGNYVFELNQDGSLLAVSFQNGGLTVFDWRSPENDRILYEESDYQQFEGGFCGKYFAFTAEKGGEALFALIDTEEDVYVGGYESADHLLLQVDETGICLADGSLLVRLDPDTMEERELAYTGSVPITAFSATREHVLAATNDGCFSFFDSGANRMSTESAAEKCDFVELESGYALVGNRSEPNLRLLQLEDHKEAQLLSYDARYPHKEARISQDGRRAMLFGPQGFCIYDMEGNLLVKEELPDEAHIYDQQFRKTGEGSWLEVIWYDGTVCCYSAEDGRMISKERGQEPEKDLYEEFFTDKYRIESSLHDAPKVYERDSDQLVATLEEDSYLTYVTQVGESIITEYISAAGERYGLLLDEEFQKLAYLPGLCDVSGDQLVFDYKSGNLRQSRLYSLQELIALGETYLQNSSKEERRIS